jgi:hypothetical protein
MFVPVPDNVKVSVLFVIVIKFIVPIVPFQAATEALDTPVTVPAELVNVRLPKLRASPYIGNAIAEQINISATVRAIMPFLVLEL